MTSFVHLIDFTSLLGITAIVLVPLLSLLSVIVLATMFVRRVDRSKIEVAGLKMACGVFVVMFAITALCVVFDVKGNQAVQDTYPFSDCKVVTVDNDGNYERIIAGLPNGKSDMTVMLDQCKDKELNGHYDVRADKVTHNVRLIWKKMI